MWRARKQADHHHLPDVAPCPVSNSALNDISFYLPPCMCLCALQTCDYCNILIRDLAISERCIGPWPVYARLSTKPFFFSSRIDLYKWFYKIIDITTE